MRPIVPVRVVSDTGERRIVHAMLDSGVNCDCITRELVARMGLKTRELMIEVQTIASHNREKNWLASFTIESLNGREKIFVENALITDSFTGDGDMPPSQRDLTRFEHLKGVKFPDVGGNIELIIGIAHAEKWLTGEVRLGGPRDPIGMRMAFGWTIAGTGGQGLPSTMSINSTSISSTQLHEAFMHIFYHDHPCVSEEELGCSRENQNAIKQLADSIR